MDLSWRAGIIGRFNSIFHFQDFVIYLVKRKGGGVLKHPPCCGLLSVPSFKWGDIGVEREIVIKNNFTFKECRSKKRR